MGSRLCLFFCLFVGARLLAVAQHNEVVLTGVYNGKNLFVQNPLSANQKDYCTQEVRVNGAVVIQNPRASAFTINLTQLPLKSPVEIRITHTDGCLPKIINPQVIRTLTSFKYLAVHADSAHISWTTNNRQKGGKFFVEHWYDEKWAPVSTLPALADQARYIATVNHNSGHNRYRIKFLQDDGEIYYSNVIEHAAAVTPITFTPTRVSDKIYLSRETDYEITDTGGNQLLKGKGTEILVGNLRTGVYYLKIDNRTEKFFKK